MSERIKTSTLKLDQTLAIEKLIQILHKGKINFQVSYDLRLKQIKISYSKLECENAAQTKTHSRR